VTILAQASDSGTWIFLTLGIAIGLVALATWVTHWIWFFRSFGLFRSFGKDNVVHSIVRKNWLSYFLGLIGFTVPIVGIMHGFAIWAGADARVGDSARIASAGQAGGRRV
jgi:hypothetical protein